MEVGTKTKVLSRLQKVGVISVKPVQSKPVAYDELTALLCLGVKSVANAETCRTSRAGPLVMASQDAQLNQTANRPKSLAQRLNGGVGILQKAPVVGSE